MAFVFTRYFGLQEYTEDSVIQMPAGLPGFEDQSTFVLIQFPNQYPLVYLQSVLRADVCFAALPVTVLRKDYQLELSDEDAASLDIPTSPKIGSEVLCLTLLAGDGSGMTANLMAPLVVDIATRFAAQCVNNAGDYSCEDALEEVVAA